MLEQVKKRKFFNYLLQYMEATLIPRIKEDWMYKYLVQHAESYKAWKQHIVVSTIKTIYTPYQTSTKTHNVNYNRLRNGLQQQKTGFNPSNNIHNNRLAKNNPSNNPD